MSNAMLYPKESRTRRIVDICGFWKFKIDFDNLGSSQNYKDGLPEDCTTVPVPSSFADLFTDRESREFAGDVWYETSFYLPKELENREVNVRFGCATHKATVYINGQEVASHVGGFVPFFAPVNKVGKFGDENKLVVVVNNELDSTTIPVGKTTFLKTGNKRKMVTPAFDFFNYSGLNRPVKITAVPIEHVDDITIVTDINGSDGIINYEIKTTGTSPVSIELLTQKRETVATAKGLKGSITVKNAKLWNPGAPYLYVMKVTIDGASPQEPIDEYSIEVGIRTVKVDGTKFLINGRPFYFKGFGKHEDSEIIGRGYNPAVIKRDFELLKWINANSFRTSHYPYSEEILQMADREGIVIIDECAAVGLNIMNFALTSVGPVTPFFETDTINETKKAHRASIEEFMRRDKNHACVCMWSIMNEPDTATEHCYDYFKEVFDYARSLDAQKRPLTFALQVTINKDKCLPVVDVICLNRYYGWYVLGGNEIDGAMALLKKELNTITSMYKDKPIVFTEFGADTMAGIHKLPASMWCEEYQHEYLEKTFAVFDSFPSVIGEQMWNFADFQTGDAIIRVDGNKKGIFTRSRQPKSAAYYLKDRWNKIHNDYKS